MAPPAKLKYQKVSGMMLARAFSVATHCTMKRIENMNWAVKPMAIQIRSLVGVAAHQDARCEKLITLKTPF